MHGDRLTDLMTFQSKKGRFCGYLILQAKNETYLGRQVKVTDNFCPIKKKKYVEFLDRFRKSIQYEILRTYFQ